MAILTKPRKRIEMVEHVRQFTYKDDPGSGFSFPCNAQGAIDLASIKPEGMDNLRACLDGADGQRAIVDDGVKARYHVYYAPAECRCTCGRRVVLHSAWANRCDCGQEFNGDGQRLAPRRFWGEETGETF